MFFGGPEEMQALPAVLVDPNASHFGTLLAPKTYKTLRRSLLLNGFCSLGVRISFYFK